MIPLFRVEEHHEAFLVWHKAIRGGVIPPACNILLHVDEHSDMAVPKLRRPLLSVGCRLVDISTLTYEELDIGNFIWPGVYQRIFSEVCWMRHRHTSQPPVRRMSIRPVNPECTEFETYIDREAVDRTMLYRQIQADSVFEAQDPVVLDIDLDYFSSHRLPDCSGRRLEVTRDAFDEFQSNPYHFLRISPGSKIATACEDGRYYFYFGDQRPRIAPVSRDEIVARMNAFIAFLQRCEVDPRLIVMCRSRFSGYTPADQWEFVERELIGRLSSLYVLKETGNNDL